MACQVCGKYSGYFPLCRDCNKLKDEGKVVKCDDCGTWHYVGEPCDCECKSKKDLFVICNDKQIDKSSQVKQNNDELLCIVCGQPSDGKHFCKSCYFKYRNKNLLLRVMKCSEFELLDDFYEGKYTCDDGHIVKSKSELAIDDYFFKKKIQHVYEKLYPIDENPAHDLHPDFYLPDLDVYLEHWGFDESNVKYIEEKNYKIPIYEKDKITLICTNEKDMVNITAALDRKLKSYKKGEINFL